MLKMKRVPPSLLYGALSLAAAFAVTGACNAQVAPPDVQASPETYKEVAGNDQYRVVEGIWKPGQRDAFHSHPRMLWYWATDCSIRQYLPDGTTHDSIVTAGHAGVQEAIASHSVENRGTSECRIVMFEPRSPD